MQPLTIIPVHGIPEVRPGDALAPLIADAAAAQDTPLLDGDCLVVTQKIVSKAEGRLVQLDPDDRDARRALVESESVRILRRRGDLIISETAHGFVCANAGVDLSNVDDGLGRAAPRRQRPLRPPHPRRAARDRAASRSASSISDTFGRPWRHGLTDVAIGVAGLAAVVDLRGTDDALGRELQVTEVAVADEVAARGRAGDGQGGRGAGRDRARPRPRVVPREHRRASWSAARRADGPSFRRERRRRNSEDGESCRRSSRRGGRSARSSTSRCRATSLDGFVEAACTRARAAPLAAVALGRRRHAPTPSSSSPTAWATRGAPTSPATACAAARVDELVDASHAKITGAPALVLGCLTWDGLDRYPDDDPPARRVGHGAAVARRRGREPHARGRRRRATRRAGWRRRSSAPRPPATRSRLDPEWLPHAMVAVGRPDPTYVGRPRPPVPLDELRARSAETGRGQRRRLVSEPVEGDGEAVVERRSTASSRGGSRRGPGSSAERGELARRARARGSAARGSRSRRAIAS